MNKTNKHWPTIQEQLDYWEKKNTGGKWAICPECGVYADKDHPGTPRCRNYCCENCDQIDRELKGMLPARYLREYDGAAEHYARHGELPQCMGSPGALDWIHAHANSEAFEQRVREIKYALSMEQIHAKYGEETEPS